MMAIDLAGLPALISTSMEKRRAVDLVWFMLAARRIDELEGQEKKKLITLLHECRVANATDPRDYCFGLLGLSVEAEDEALRPDYSRSVAEVYRQYATYFVGHGDGINMLHNAGGADADCQGENLPSWVPDWARRDFVEPKLCPSPHTSYVKPLAYHAGTFFKPCVSIDDYNPDILKIKGVLLDEIAFLRSACEMNSNLDVSHLTLESDRNVAPIMHLVANCVLELRHMLGRDGLSRYPTKEDDEDVVWRTLICNREYQSSSVAPPEHVEYYRAFHAAMRKFDPSWPVLNYTRTHFKGPDQLARENAKFLGGSSEFCSTRLCALTNKGYVGQFPLETQMGDCIPPPPPWFCITIRDQAEGRIAWKV